MRKFSTFILFLISVFILNIVFYFLSDDYRFFLKKLKNGNEVVYENEAQIDDSFSVKESQEPKSTFSNSLSTLSFFPLVKKEDTSEIVL